MFGHVASSFTFFYADHLLLTATARKKSCKKFNTSRYNSKVHLVEYLDSIWNKRNKLAKDLISKMLNKNPAERINAE